MKLWKIIPASIRRKKRSLYFPILFFQRIHSSLSETYEKTLMNERSWKKYDRKISSTTSLTRNLYSSKTKYKETFIQNQKKNRAAINGRIGKKKFFNNKGTIKSARE